MAAMVVPAALGGGAARAAGPAGTVEAQVESYALRVEYDIPLPVGTGTVAHVSGDARRSTGGENAKGIAGAPTELDPVVGKEYLDPQGTGHPQRALPQTECFYPGSLVNTHFWFPTQVQTETQGVPPTGYATARCSAGPEVELHGHAQGSDAPDGPTAALAPVVTVGSAASDSLARPVRDRLDAETASRASGLSILGGAVKIGSVAAAGHSSTTGTPGGATSRADVAVSDVDAGGSRFALTTATVDGKEQVQITAGGQTMPADSSGAKSLVDGINAALKPQGCSVTPLTSPDRYPQGFLFSRPEPEVGVKDDGSLAASYRGGLLVVCDLPRSLTDNFGGFSPQRVQIVVGFAFTSTTAGGAVGGFGLGDLGGGGDLGGSAVLGGFRSAPASAPSFTPGPAPDVAAPAPVAPTANPPATARASRVAAILPFRMDPTLRWLFGLIGLAGWALLTHLGARRFLWATAPCPARDGGGR